MFSFFLSGHPVEMCLLSNNVHDYYFVSQGKTTIPGLDDGDELLVTDVSATIWTSRRHRSRKRHFIETKGIKRIYFSFNIFL